MNAKWILALLPAVVGSTVAVLTGLGWLTNPVVYVRSELTSFYLRAQVGPLALLAGVLLTLIAVAHRARVAWLQANCGRRVREAQAEATAERHRFLRRLDHELKNPLTVIHGGLMGLLNGTATEAQRESLDFVDSQVLRLSRLTEDLRKLAELETSSLERAPVDLNEVVREAVALVQEPAAETRQLAVLLPQAPWSVPAVPGDRDLLLLAIYNLLNNAFKFTSAGDSVEVRAFEDGASVSIEVADSGPGVPEEELPHLGKDLYRGQGARGLPGSGLGLALARAIVERHGGKLTIRSRVGQGTVVRVQLPLE